MKKKGLKESGTIYNAPANIVRAAFQTKKESWSKDMIPTFRKAVAAEVVSIDGKPTLKIPVWDLTDQKFKGMGKITRNARWIVFLQKDPDQYCTYYPHSGGWLTSMYNHLEPRYYCPSYGTYSAPKTDEVIRTFLGEEDGKNAGKMIDDFQGSTHDGYMRKKYRSLLEETRAEMDQVPDLPKNWEDWVAKNTLPQYLFYEYSKGKIGTGWCSCCRQNVQLKVRPKYDMDTTCPRCRHPVQYKSVGKFGFNRSEDKSAVIVQPLPDREYVVRYFRERSYFYQDRITGKISRKIEEWEFKRSILSERMVEEKEYIWDKVRYQPGGMFWKPVPPQAYYGMGKEIYNTTGGVVYPGNLKDICARIGRKYTPLDKFFRMERHNCYYPVRILRALVNDECGLIEKLLKVGLITLARKVMDTSLYELGDIAPKYSSSSGNLIDMLDLTRQQYRKMMQLPDEYRDVSIMRMLRKPATYNLTVEQLKWLCDAGSRGFDLVKVLQYTTLHKIQRYVDEVITVPEEQHTCDPEFPGLWRENSRQQRIGLWVDYLQMRRLLEYDMDDIGLFPKDLDAMHDRMVIEREENKQKIRMREVEENFPEIRKNRDRLRKIYEWQQGKLFITPAGSASEIVLEGATLHHCVGSSDRYMGAHARGESYILFLRRADHKKTRFATVEIKDAEILQWYEAYDKQPDKKEIEAWLKKFTAVVKKRLEKAQEHAQEQIEETENQERILLAAAG